MLYIGIDNGVSGSIGVLSPAGACVYHEMSPTVQALNYTKRKAWLRRIDHVELARMLGAFLPNARCAVERPMVNPGRFMATASALRALESTLIILEGLRIPYEYVDSRQWQKALLPSGLHKEELKSASDAVCARLFPERKMKTAGDGDSLLIAEWLRRKYEKAEPTK